MKSDPAPGDVLIIIMVRWPEEGRVKSRLAREIGDPMVVELYRSFVMDTLENVRKTGLSFAIGCHPSERMKEMSIWLGDGIQYLPQSGNDLGSNQLDLLFTGQVLGYAKVIVTISDSPDLPRGIISEAVSLLDLNDAVIGPCSDGGYHLLGTSVPLRGNLLDGIEWSMDTVLDDVISRFEGDGLSIARTDIWHDIDESEDLRSLAERWADGKGPKRTMATLSRILRRDRPDDGP